MYTHNKHTHAEAVAEAFVRLHEKGLIYKGSYMVNWSPALLTAVSDLEVEYSEEPGFLYYFKWVGRLWQLVGWLLVGWLWLVGWLG